MGIEATLFGFPFYKKKKIVESTELTRIMFESSGLIGKRAWPVLLKCTSLNVYISFLTIDPLQNKKIKIQDFK